jgi:hypothetical protein
MIRMSSWATSTIEWNHIDSHGRTDAGTVGRSAGVDSCEFAERPGDAL